MDERRFGGFSRELPSPDELFHADEWEEQEQSRKRIEVPVQKEENKPEEACMTGKSRRRYTGAGRD